MCRPTVEAAGERARCPVSPSQPAPRRSRAQKGAAQRRARPDSRGLSGEHCGTTNQRAGRHRHHRRTHRARLLPTAPARSCGVRAHRADSQGVVRQHRRRRGGDSSQARRRGSCLHDALAHHGWCEPEPSVLHVRVPRSASRLRSPQGPRTLADSAGSRRVVLHQSRYAPTGDRQAVSLGEAIAQAHSCTRGRDTL